MSAIHCSPPPADLSPDDVFQEVFLRLPPDPSFLLAASLVCRRWRRLIRCPAFLRRFRAFHRTPPVLGFFQNLWTLSCPPGMRIRFVPTASTAARISPPPGYRGLVVDCCHGRVVLYSYSDKELLVWDPMTGDTHYVSAPPDLIGEDVAAALVCAAGHGDHNDCHSSPFQISSWTARTTINAGYLLASTPLKLTPGAIGLQFQPHLLLARSRAPLWQIRCTGRSILPRKTAITFLSLNCIAKDWV